MSQQIQFLLRAAEMPTHWYNLLADFPEPLPPPLHPGTREPVTPDIMLALFPENLVAQEMSGERMIEIPQEVRDVYATAPPARRRRLEKTQTPAHTGYKLRRQPRGQPRPTPRFPGLLQKVAGTKRLASETGAGQWGSSLAFACSVFGLECNIYMVKVSFDQKPYRKLLMQTYGATVHASPSNQTEFGRKVLAANPNSDGSLGIAISEAIEDTVKHPGTKDSLGSVLNHVCLHKSIIGQRRSADGNGGRGARRDSRCAGGGSNFAGLVFRSCNGKPRGPHRHVEPPVPVAHEGRFALLFWRHGGDDAVGDDVYARPPVHATEHPRWRPALSRMALMVATARSWADRRRGVLPKVFESAVPARSEARARARVTRRPNAAPKAGSASSSSISAQWSSTRRV